jgi:hypothetical protein
MIFYLKKKQIKLNKYKLLIIIIQRKNTQLFYIRFKILAKNDKKVYILVIKKYFNERNKIFQLNQFSFVSKVYIHF